MEGFSEIWVSVRLTIELASITTVILLILGTPLAWWLARSKSMWSEAVATIIILPPLLPQRCSASICWPCSARPDRAACSPLSGASARLRSPSQGSLSDRF